MPGYNYGGSSGGMRRGNPRKGQYNDRTDPESEQYRKLFIGGLSYETTDDGLKDHFEKWGEIEDHIVMKDTLSKRSRGFGFVTYKLANSLDEAQACRPHVLDGRQVETKRAMPREESEKPDIHSRATKMFIGGMKVGTTEEQIREVFEEFGAIKKVDLPIDKSGNQRNYAFVEFEDYDAVDRCVLKKDFMLNDKNVEVKKAKQKDSQGGEGRGGGRGGKAGYGGRGAGNFGMTGQEVFGGGFGQQGGYQGYSGGYGGGYDDGSGYGGGYNQGGGHNQGGFGNGGSFGGNQGGGNWGGFGQGYGGFSGGGPMKGGYGGGSQRGGVPYNSGRGGGRGGGFNR